MVWNKSQRAYAASEKGKASRLKYQQSDKAREARKKYYEKRKVLKLANKEVKETKSEGTIKTSTPAKS